MIHFVTPDFFETLSIPLVRGRSFTDRDDAAAPAVTVIGTSLAERLWPGQDPLGRQLTALGVSRTVVGVARNIAVRSIVHDADAAQAVSDVRLLDDILATQTAPRRDQLAVLGAFVSRSARPAAGSCECF